jgi:hypothetical protein
VSQDSVLVRQLRQDRVRRPKSYPHGGDLEAEAVCTGTGPAWKTTIDTVGVCGNVTSPAPRGY